MNRLKEFREMRQLSQVELARQARMASTNLSAIEHGRLIAWPKARAALAQALGYPESEVFPSDNGNKEV